MQNFLEAVKNLFRNHLLKIFFFLGACIVLFVLLFPTNDLGDLVTNMVSEQTNKQVFIQFDDLGFTIIPAPGVGMKNVYLETQMAPPMNIEALTLSPSVASLLSFKNGLSAVAEGFLGGEVNADWKEGEETKKGELKQNIEIELEEIQLTELLKLIEAPVELFGQIEGSADAVIDPSFSEQPTSDIALEIKNFRFPAGAIPTPMGDFPVPEVKVSKIKLKGRMLDGEFYVDELIIGDKKDQINGIVKGKIRIRIQQAGIQIMANPGRYEFDVNINVLPGMQKELQLPLGLLDNYKKVGVGYNSYCMIVAGLNTYNPPNRIESKPKCL